MGSPALKDGDALIHNLPMPVCVVTQAAELVDSNRAFRDLAEQTQSGGSLTEMFGAPFHRVLSRAWIERHIQTTMPVLTGPEPRSTYRASFMSTSSDKTLGVVLQDVTSELEYRRLLTERDRDFSVLSDISVGLSATLDLEQLIERVHGAVQRATPCSNIYIALFDRESNTITFPRYMEEGEWKNETSRPAANGLTEYLIRTGKPLLLNDQVVSRAAELGIKPVGRPCRSWMGAPMVVDGEAMGVIGLQDYEREGVYDEKGLELLALVASQAAAAVKNAQAIIAERRAHHEVAQAQARMIETERLRGVTETVGALNHEINNPLAAIAGNAQLLIRKSEGIPEPVIAKIKSIHEAAQRIQRVTVKMASLIQASSMPYPGDQSIIDVENSVSGPEEPPADPSIEAHERPIPAATRQR